MDWLWLSFYHALAMLWATFWALVLGFTISGVLQVFVSNEQMTRAFGRTNLKSVAHAFVTDWSMLWKEILGGFLIAGFLATLVPHDWWETLFLQTGPAVVRLIENALVGPIIAVISFVCSVGNIPLASLLWAHGISFGGVISFIYADLLVIPILVIYARYYGVLAAPWINGLFYLPMVLRGTVVD